MIQNLLANAITRYLQLDPESTNRLRSLEGHTIAIQLLPFHMKFQCVFKEANIEIHFNEISPPEVKITGTPLQLMNVALNPKDRQAFFAEDIKMEGNAELGQQVIALFDELHIDWEDYLSRGIGDIPAHHVGNLARKTLARFKEIRQQITQDTSDYLQEEAHFFPSRLALDDFYNDIDTLRMGVDRAETRIDHLWQLLDSDQERVTR